MSHYSLPSGTKLGENYEIRGLLGSGGFGITYEAWDVEFQRVVAIKEYFPFDLTIRLPGSNMVVPRDDGTKGDFEKGMAQFVEEGRTLAKFADNTIVRATNFVKMNDTVYMVMEYQEGSSLSKFLTEQEGPLSEEQILNIFVPVMQALEKVHRAEILHRDLKPDNIYIRNDGTPVLLDFGAARQKVVGKTRSLTSMLSPGYAPLEQYHTRGNQGPWTDIYALGATMYYCTTGKKPEDVTARMGASHTGTPDPMPLATLVARGMYSEKLLSTIDWMLRLNERDRPQSLVEVLDRLEEIESKPGAKVVLSPVQTEVVTSNIRREGVSSEAKTKKLNIESVGAVRPSRKSRKSIALYSLLGLIVVVLAGLGFIQWSKRDDQVTNVERKILPEETPSEAAPVSTDREEATRLAEEQRQKQEAARLAEEQRQKQEAARLAEQQRQKQEAARLAEQQRQKQEAARSAEEQRQKQAAARSAEEQRQKQAAARLAEEQRQKQAAARSAEEQRQKQAAARSAEEQRQKQEAARLAEEQRQKQAAAR
jgi:serine/threonine protein kinase